MALQEICGLANAPYMKSRTHFLKSVEEDMKNSTSNIDNCYSLAAPPFENVSIFNIFEINLI